MKEQVDIIQFINASDKSELQLIINGNKFSEDAIKTLTKLKNLGILTEEVLVALIAQAPVDPLGLLAFCSSLGGWIFRPSNFSAVKVLAKDKESGEPSAYAVIDIISNSLYFINKEKEGFVERKMYSPEEIISFLQGKENREEALKALIEDEIVKTVQAIS